MRRLLATVALGAALGCAAAPLGQSQAAAAVQAAYLANIDALDRSIASLNTAVDAPASQLQAAFRAARLRWKRVEYLAELFNPDISKSINGPPISRVAEDDPNQIIRAPEGFQPLEELLFPTVDDGAREQVRQEVAVLHANVRRLRRFAAATTVTDAAVFDALRLEVARIITLGLAGFDSPAARHSLPEAAAAFEAIDAALEAYAYELRRRDPDAAERVRTAIDRTIASLDETHDPEGFDYLTFITRYANEVARALHAARTALAIPFPQAPRAWASEAATVFDANAIDPLYFAPPGTPRATAAQVALGARLFFDPVLSRNGERSCVTCHQAEFAFTDRRATAPALRTGITLRNTPTVINAALQPAAFADLRVAYLEDQAAAVITSPDEMGGSLPAILRALGSDPTYRAAFGAAFPQDRGTLTAAAVHRALAAYVRSLTTMNARFDRHIRGDEELLSDAEQRGFNLFMGKAACATCHFLPLFNGTVPPTFQEIEWEVIGVPAHGDRRAPARVSPDRGRERVHGIRLHRHAFKTTTVRNVALTAPYMHNGVFPTLEDVIEFYDAGGGAGLGIRLPNQTLPADSLGLTRTEKKDLAAFLLALTDTSGVRPQRP